MNSNTFDRLSFLSLTLTIVLLPLFFLPFADIPVEVSKGLLLVLGLAFSILFWATARFFDGKIAIPKSALLLSGGAVSLALLLATLFSRPINVSMFGTMLDTGSFLFVFAGFVLMLVSATLFRTEGQARLLLFGVVLSAMVLLLFQTARMFLPEVMSLGVFDGKMGNIFGSWNSLGLFAGFATLLFLLVGEFFPIARLWKILLQVFIILALLFVAVVNFTMVWTLVGISSLIIFVYKASLSFQNGEETSGKRRFPILAFVVVLVSLVFLTAGSAVRNFLPDYLGISNSEVGPSLKATLNVAKGVIAEKPVFGMGPNRFGEAWARYKPVTINNTVFWNVPFETGYGTLPTFMATTGIVGILAWFSFLVLFLLSGVRSVFQRVKDNTNWEIMAVFILALYLFIAMLFYASGAVVFLLGLAFTGVFTGLSAWKNNKEISWTFLNDHRKSFFSILVLILLVIASIALAFRYVERLASVPYLRKAIQATDITVAQAAITRAVGLNYNDLYLRTYSQVYLAKLNSILSAGTALSEEQKTELQNVYSQAVNSAQLAVTYNPTNYQNFSLQATIYEASGALGIKDAYPQALIAYENASKLNPNNPALKLGMARVAFALDKRNDAITYAEEALKLAPNNPDVVKAVNAIKAGNTPTPITEEVSASAN